MSSPSADSYESHARKRVGKACDRCRLKKSKCDGASPCSRCKIDNAICIFGERKKSHDRVYPKGYVEMLEHQQSQIVAGLRQTYRMLVKQDKWPGSALKEYDGHPLTHDILEHLGILHRDTDSADSPRFEDDLAKLQERLIVENGVSATRPRRRSPASDEELETEHSGSPHDSPTTRNSSISSSFARKRSPSMTQEEYLEIRPSPKQPKYESFSRSKQSVLDYNPAMIPAPYVVSSPNLDVSGIDLNFTTDEAVSMYDPLYTSTYFAPAITTMQANGGYAVGFDADFDIFQHSGLHDGTTC